MTELTNLAKNLKDLRKQYEYTQTKVANEIGITCSSYQAYEWGTAYPTLQNFVKLANLYGVSLDELIE
ncbi:MAG: helix-turn-helix domain-containing protein [Clostridia bacterium]|nr:helix-turn-helix domain-containing protein [Clostridia bacterium]